MALYCHEAVGVDPEPGMVEAARAAAARAGAAARFIEGRFEDVAGKLGAFDIVTIGRAIRWLDPEPAQGALERALAPHGKVLVRGATSAKDGRNPWLEAFMLCVTAGRAIDRRAITRHSSPMHSSPDRNDPGRGDV